MTADAEHVFEMPNVLHQAEQLETPVVEAEQHAHADIVDLDAIFLDEADDKANPMGIKGVGELGICGAGAAVANAIYNATGVRLRDYPMTPEKVLEGMLAAGL